ncbi:hypothetical protein SCLCIDRAFT_1220214 [Scleroderma citrinum Foug A]|uniref:Uncharacterized protein n=1 Tax=Scleroderma citrinum Foug A TaxID=1036808 RepID=A0A0C3D7D3_9AGAM|nr:hypothetical protein SCLCIDRAFT_1220214 [Scleroderma citrinum Foug A]
MLLPQDTLCLLESQVTLCPVVPSLPRHTVPNPRAVQVDVRICMSLVRSSTQPDYP